MLICWWGAGIKAWWSTCSFSFGDVYVIRTVGWWMQKGRRMWNSLYLFLFLDGQLERLETLLNNFLSFVDVHLARMRGSSYFSELCKTNTLTILMHQMRISTTQVSSVMLRSKKLKIRKQCENWKSHRMKTKQCHEIEPNPSKDRAMPEGDNPSFWDEFSKFTFFLTVQFIDVEDVK
jgi:hypothetical protein